MKPFVLANPWFASARQRTNWRKRLSGQWHSCGDCRIGVSAQPKPCDSTPMASAFSLPPGVTVFERGWLSSNNVLLDDGIAPVLIDTGYCTHAEQTLALVAHALGDRPLAHVLNTH